MEIKFFAYNPFIKQQRADRGWRVEFDVSQEQYDLIRELPKLEDRMLKITIEDGGENLG